MDLYLPTSRLAGSHQRALDKLVLVHHSLTDWDFQSGKGFHIRTDQFVSSPSSLARPAGNGQGSYGYCFLKEALGLCIAEGRISTYWRFPDAIRAAMQLYARVQALPTNQYPDDGYMAFCEDGGVFIYELIGGVLNLRAGWVRGFNLPPNIWYGFRFTWYNWLTADLASVLRLIIEELVDSTWTERLQFDDTTPTWDTSATNRVGFTILGASLATRCYIDDTIIEKRV